MASHTWNYRHGIHTHTWPICPLIMAYHIRSHAHAQHTWHYTHGITHMELHAWHTDIHTWNYMARTCTHAWNYTRVITGMESHAWHTHTWAHTHTRTHAW